MESDEKKIATLHAAIKTLACEFEVKGIQTRS
jgi:hypothetical protein